MKISFIFFVAFSVCLKVHAQTNTFPSNGNVGLGTLYPTTGLQLGELNGNITSKQIMIPGTYNFEKVMLGQIGNGNSALEMVNHNSAESSYGVRILANIDNGGPGLQLQYAQPKSNYSELEYQTGLMLSVSGNIGIGTVSPNEKLSVNGKIRAQEVKVETANWPDYVFEQNYKLDELSVLENFIKRHKHLPEMPDAKTLEQDGLMLGDMVKLQQKKIEELTLHLIDKDKIIRDLLQRMEKVENQLTTKSKY
ncbi:hypothetical protein QWY86_15465 [Pedobacter aquatilis]|uniref:hypothetical protein n=1 Tax=Pedobacter aquatilis TaxID=351343 RepID=UPI0025B52873|nr:hypothetical protein [Pedobacter aquatilis]MDN3588081.1 hypothetical protein [Pedobacter aquatilis]